MPKDSVQCLSLNLSAQEAQDFRQIVKSLGFQRGKSTDLSGFGRAIANKDLLVLRQENELAEIIRELVKVGRYELASKISEMIEIETDLPQFLNQIQQLIILKQPFRLEYLDVAGKPYSFDCSYAQISTYEAREYLEVRRINLPDNSAALLRNNHCLRIDRLPDSSQISISSLSNVEWQELKKIDVEYSLKGNLILSYVPEIGDSQQKISLPGEETILKVRTQITSDYWFIRKILKFGSSAEILKPDFLRAKINAEIQKISELYVSEI